MTMQQGSTRESPPLVSVIVPALNVERFLAQAIDSVIAQTFDRWELIVVDDGSTDRTPLIAREYVQQDPHRIRYVTHPRQRSLGASASRNLGIRNAKGAYIAFLDADDVWLPQKLERQAAILESRPDVAMLYGPAEYWHSWTGNPEDAGRDYMKSGLGVVPNTIVDPPTLVGILVRDRLVPCIDTILVRRDAIERIGGFEDRFRRVYTDQVLLTKLCLEARVYVSGDCWTRYRMHPDSSIQVAEREGAREAARLQFLTWLRRHLSKKGFAGSDLSSLVEEEAVRSCDRVASHAGRLLGDGDYRKALWQIGQILRYQPKSLLRHACPALYHGLASIRDRARQAFLGVAHGVSRSSTGTIVADPNPIRISGGSDLGETALSWNARGTDVVEVRVGAPDGPLLSRSGRAGQVRTGPWVYGGQAFYLQDASSGEPPTAGHTLAIVKVRATARLLRCASEAVRRRPRSDRC